MRKYSAHCYKWTAFTPPAQNSKCGPIDETSVAKATLMKNSVISICLGWFGTIANAVPVMQAQRKTPLYQISTRNCSPIQTMPRYGMQASAFQRTYWCEVQRGIKLPGRGSSKRDRWHNCRFSYAGKMAKHCVNLQLLTPIRLADNLK